ncbi:TerC family protein [Algoriphagus aquimarinus]|uniref:Tellurite resistance protein TerC n=1 Tax=Algoriphagus aquimarinus TaxID=237018 RepID=A0A1I1BNW3_9BACT|nr:TerC family protein [Algoriphagus aquimarinus]SFB50130.1 tellurite resistance protein TerC [Algoriphagus aquimarinus]
MIVWTVFIVIVILALILDLGVFNRKPHEIKTKEAAIWTSVWVACAILFSGIVYLSFQNNWIANPTNLTPSDAVIKYITGYLIELSLSVDNIFIIALIFSSFAIPKKYQHEVLFYGVLGAIVFRALMILFGVALITKFNWMIYVFGAFLILTALKMLFSHNSQKDPHDFIIYKWISKVYPVTTTVEGDKFFIINNGVKYATPLFVALIIIELTDVFFAIDSIPAILAITADPFIVFSSNILAIMGLRSMFFLVVGMLDKFKYINYSLVVILAFVGIKMIISHQVEIPEWLSLGVIVISLAGGMIASKLVGKTEIE